MWKRSDLKARAKVSFKRNYWKSVLISLFLALIVGGSSGGAASSAGSSGVQENRSVTEEHIYTPGDDGDLDFDASESDGSDDEDPEEILEEFEQKMRENDNGSANVAVAIAFVIGFVITFVLVMGIIIVLSAFVANPLEVGCKRFYLRNLNEPAQVGNIGYAFDNNYKNIVKTM